MTYYLINSLKFNICFQINVGCTDETISANPISLEFSRDHGSTWNLLKPDCFSQNWSSSVCSGQVSEPSVYYIGELQPWKRVTILINGLHICGYEAQFYFLYKMELKSLSTIANPFQFSYSCFSVSLLQLLKSHRTVYKSVIMTPNFLRVLLFLLR